MGHGNLFTIGYYEVGRSRGKQETDTSKQKWLIPVYVYVQSDKSLCCLAFKSTLSYSSYTKQKLYDQTA